MLPSSEPGGEVYPMRWRVESTDSWECFLRWLQEGTFTTTFTVDLESFSVSGAPWPEALVREDLQALTAFGGGAQASWRGGTGWRIVPDPSGPWREEGTMRLPLAAFRGLLRQRRLRNDAGAVLFLYEEVERL